MLALIYLFLQRRVRYGLNIEGLLLALELVVTQKLLELLLGFQHGPLQFLVLPSQLRNLLLVHLSVWLRLQLQLQSHPL